ncbi:hypothetical protein GGQ17_001245 [Salinibacter ruber]|nr:hypothetical protein [Salinibacter ruber]
MDVLGLGDLHFGSIRLKDLQDDLQFELQAVNACSWYW